MQNCGDDDKCRANNAHVNGSMNCHDDIANDKKEVSEDSDDLGMKDVHNNNNNNSNNKENAGKNPCNGLVVPTELRVFMMMMLLKIMIVL